MDPATAQVVLQLQLQDITNILKELSSSNAKLSDNGAAFRTLLHDLQKELGFLRNRSFALRILHSEHDDRILVEQCVRKERQAIEDNALAYRLAECAIRRKQGETHRSRSP